MGPFPTVIKKYATVVSMTPRPAESITLQDVRDLTG